MTDQEFATALAYDVLGLKPGASEIEARTARLQLVRSYHPDTFEGDRAQADRHLAKINAAFDDVMVDLRDRGAAMSAQDRAWAKAARQSQLQRKAQAARQSAQRAHREAETARATAARAQRTHARSAEDLASMSGVDRAAHRAAQAGFATTRNILRGDVKNRLKMRA